MENQTAQEKATHVAVKLELFEKLVNYLVSKPLIEVEVLVNEIRQNGATPIVLNEPEEIKGKELKLNSKANDQE